MLNHPAMMYDVIFKIVFGTEQSGDLLRALLNALLRYTGDDRIAEVTILDPSLPKTLGDKGVLLDVKARDHRGRLFNVEVQLCHEPDYAKRSVYYLTRLFSSQLDEGETYEALEETVGISLLDHVLFPAYDDIHSVFTLYDRDHDQRLTDVLQLHYVELAKLKKESLDTLRTPYDKWIYALKFAEIYERGLEPLPLVLQQEEGIEMAINKMRHARASEQVREIIERYEKARRDEASRLLWARRAGVQEGRELGLEQGRELGLEQAREEMARRMRADGLDPETIEKYTGVRLPPDDLEGDASGPP